MCIDRIKRQTQAHTHTQADWTGDQGGRRFGARLEIAIEIDSFPLFLPPYLHNTALSRSVLASSSAHTVTLATLI